jgi:hypothetical protein
MRKLIKECRHVSDAQIAPRIKPAQSGAKRRWSSGRATPRQPNSSIGPITSPTSNAGSTSYQGENGNESVIVPLMAAPT